MIINKIPKTCIALILLPVLLLSLWLPTGISNAALPDSGGEEEPFEETEQQRKELREQLRESRLKESEILDEILSLEMDILEAEEDIARIDQEIVEVQKKIHETEMSLKEVEESILLKNGTLEERVNTMYRQGTLGYLQVLFTSRSFSDLLTNLDMIRLIANQDVQLLEELEWDKLVFEVHHLLLEEQKATLTRLLDEVTREKHRLETVLNTQESLRQEVQLLIDEIEDELEILEGEAYETILEIEMLVEESEPLLEEIREQKEENEEADLPHSPSWPVPGFTRLSSPYGWRNHPISHLHRFHHGIDIPAPEGTPIVAAKSGIVLITGARGSYGVIVSISHGDGLATLYAHNSVNLVNEGDYVEQGQTIALIGSTGNSTGPHLHFEVIREGIRENPLSWLNQ